MFGDDGEEVTPVPIPNTEVKLFSADGSWGSPPVRVGRRQAKKISELLVFFYYINERDFSNHDCRFLAFIQNILFRKLVISLNTTFEAMLEKAISCVFVDEINFQRDIHVLSTLIIHCYEQISRFS
jgi:hypothetical protein